MAEIMLMFLAVGITCVIAIIRILKKGSLLSNNRLNKTDNPAVFYAMLVFLMLLALFMFFMGILSIHT